MAAQTEAPDDLIAELARLMAEDARSDSTAPPPADKPGSIRIPGGDLPVAASQPAPVRIPGGATDKSREAASEPFNFDFAFTDFADRAAGPATPLAKPAEPVMAETPPPAAPSPEPEALDYDGLSDLIAAELANGLTPPQPAPVAEVPARSEDNFGVPPVFGLGAPVPPAPAPEPVAVFAEAEPVEAEPEYEPVIAAAPEVQARDPGDALADIERLIAPVVQKAQEQAEAVRAPSPALRSLATPVLPSAEPAPHFPPAEPGSVDDAILAAAAATGARVEWVEPEPDEVPFAAEQRAETPRNARRALGLPRAVAGPLVAVGLLAVAGFGLYWLLGQNGAPAGPAPLLLADTSAVKEVPAPVETTSQQSVVFNEISGAGNSADEQIVPRDQADETALTEAAGAGIGSGILATDDSTVVDPNQEGLVNRKVRTVTVRPDGTIVSGTDSMAGASILPVERPNVPEVPGADFSTPDLIASTIAASEQPSALAPAPETTPIPVVANLVPGSVVPVVDAAGAPVAGRSVTVPMNRPDDFAQAAAAALAASALPAGGNGALPAAPSQPAAAAPAVSASTSGAAAYVQLASQRSEEAALQSAQAMATRFGLLFSGASPEIQRVDLGERGIYYRVLVPAASRDAAANICTNVKAAGGDCLLL